MIVLLEVTLIGVHNKSKYLELCVTTWAEKLLHSEKKDLPWDEWRLGKHVSHKRLVSFCNS